LSSEFVGALNQQASALLQPVIAVIGHDLTVDAKGARCRGANGPCWPCAAAACCGQVVAAYGQAQRWAGGQDVPYRGVLRLCPVRAAGGVHGHSSTKKACTATGAA
jgi:hypothetical protein